MAGNMELYTDCGYLEIIKGPMFIPTVGDSIDVIATFTGKPSSQIEYFSPINSSVNCLRPNTNFFDERSGFSVRFSTLETE